MRTAWFTSEDCGFQVCWDADVLRAVIDWSDVRLQRTAASLLDELPAAGLLLTAASEASTAAVVPPYILLTTDGKPTAARALADWNWHEITRRFAASAIQRFGVPSIGVGHYYWHGYPMLQLHIDAEAGGWPEYTLGRTAARLFTPQQIFTLFMDLTGLTDETVTAARQRLHRLVPPDPAGARGPS
jgi:hypothetical protein